MNIYTIQFSATCPVNEAPIAYTLTLTTDRTVMVEVIKDEVARCARGFHEDLADMLSFNLGGVQEIEAVHHGVHIKTVRRNTENPGAPGGHLR